MTTNVWLPHSFNTPIEPSTAPNKKNLYATSPLPPPRGQLKQPLLLQASPRYGNPHPYLPRPRFMSIPGTLLSLRQNPPHNTQTQHFRPLPSTCIALAARSYAQYRGAPNYFPCAFQVYRLEKFMDPGQYSLRRNLVCSSEGEG